MAVDPEFIKKVQERKAKREALESKYSHQKGHSRGAPATGSSRTDRKKGPVYRSVSLLSGETVTISGEEARKRDRKATYNG